MVPHPAKGDQALCLWRECLRQEGKLTHSGHHRVIVLVEMESLVQGTRRHGFVSVLVPCEGLRSASICRLGVGGCMLLHKEQRDQEADRLDFECDFDK